MAGATLNELEKWDNGGYDKIFMAKVVAWARGHHVVENNKQDAVARKMKQDSKKGI